MPPAVNAQYSPGSYRLSGSIGRSDDPEQVDVGTRYDAGEIGNGAFVRLRTEQDLFHPGKFLVDDLESR